MGKFFANFKKFINRGNVVDMTVGVVVALNQFKCLFFGSSLIYQL